MSHDQDDKWVTVWSAPVDDMGTGFSARASDLVQLLTGSGIAAEERWSVAPRPGYHMFVDKAERQQRTHALVVVRRRDAEAAQAFVASLAQEGAAAPISDEELTRQALAAGDPPPD